jgi:hypothetical protein
MNGREAMCRRDDLLGADHTSKLQFHLVPISDTVWHNRLQRAKA